MVQLVYFENLDANTAHLRPFFMYDIIGATRNVLLLPEKARLQSLLAGTRRPTVRRQSLQPHAISAEERELGWAVSTNQSL